MIYISWVEAGNVAHMTNEKCIKHFIRRSEGKRLLGRSRYRWEDNIKIKLKGIGCEDVNWNHLAQDRYRRWTLLNK
jgi:hypothetical protein